MLLSVKNWSLQGFSEAAAARNPEKVFTNRVNGSVQLPSVARATIPSVVVIAAQKCELCGSVLLWRCGRLICARASCPRRAG
jgi:hypothetical protein